MLPDPMWKLTGRSSSTAASHSGSQWWSPMNGCPNACGSPVNRMPRWPIAAQRRTSRTEASMSQNGVDAMGSRRRESAEAHSVCQSL